MTAGTPEIDQTDVAKKDRVFLHESKGKMYVARPFDLLQVELGITDPILNVVHYVGKTCSKNVVVIDSRSHAAGMKPVYAHRLFKKSSAPATGTILKKCHEFPIPITFTYGFTVFVGLSKYKICEVFFYNVYIFLIGTIKAYLVILVHHMGI